MIETTQLFGSLLSIISHTYVYSQVFDINDIFLNTLGGVVGYLLARYLYVKLSQKEKAI
ncbi:VanZ family protein [Lysinibacillus piscis]|uniref:VanZ family protein n=1 Tax=Lysinibacillus piscis TaxID=2518931 RepID=UPI0035A22863